MNTMRRWLNLATSFVAVSGWLGWQVLVIGLPLVEAAWAAESQRDTSEEARRPRSAQVVRPPGDRPKSEVQSGRWRRFRSHRADPDLTPEQAAMIEELEALGYLSGTVEGGGESGVTRYDTQRAWSGLNFYTSGHAPGAILADMNGRQLHSWRYSFETAFPDSDLPAPDRSKQFWRRAYLFANGDVLAIFDGRGIIKLDKDSKLLWSALIGAHHDLHVMPSGEIYVLTREARMIPRIRESRPVLEDFISVLDANGKETKRVSLLECVENSEFKDLALSGRLQQEGFSAGTTNRRGDIFHTNSIEVLDGSIAAKVPEFAEGNILISMRVPSLLAVVDLDQKKLIWAMQGSFKHQHDPKILANGNLLFFDNRGLPRQSRVIEFDPADRSARWEYTGSASDPFFSEACGTAERLPNGNTLITESDNGRAFELTPDETLVWEFFNPHRAGDQGQFIATLFELVRLPADFPIGWASGASP